jgi:phosphomannomutase
VIESVAINELMTESNVAFGTSGARGLVCDMTDRVCAAYTIGFLQHITNSYGTARELAIGGDHRPSTGRILAAVAFAAERLGVKVTHLGRLPSPAVALYGFTQKCPTVMVTGSHIPADRNGMKFTTPNGEFSKADEAAMRREVVHLPEAFDRQGALQSSLRPELRPPLGSARTAYLQRYLDAFPPGCLRGLRVVVYGHSSVAREILGEIYATLGATITPFGYAEEFVPVDTEAIRPEDINLARELARSTPLDAIVSTDGDADRPLIADEAGEWFRGDVAGILTAQYLGADGVACPVSCNTAVEQCASFKRVLRTRIGSPFVIDGMGELTRSGYQNVVGYEANGGFLTASPLAVPGGSILPALPTRDPIVVHLALLASALQKGVRLSALRACLPKRFTGSDRDPSFATARSQALLAHLLGLSSSELESALGLGSVAHRDDTDGLRFTFVSKEILHYRPSGNAPELRCYAEAATESRANELVRYGLDRARALS